MKYRKEAMKGGKVGTQNICNLTKEMRRERERETETELPNEGDETRERERQETGGKGIRLKYAMGHVIGHKPLTTPLHPVSPFIPRSRVVRRNGRSERRMGANREGLFGRPRSLVGPQNGHDSSQRGMRLVVTEGWEEEQLERAHGAELKDGEFDLLEHRCRCGSSR